jgi:hypothetical protein
LLVGRPRVKSTLAGLSLNQEASQTELEGVQKMAQQRRTSLRAPAVVTALLNKYRHCRVLAKKS